MLYSGVSRGALGQRSASDIGLLASSPRERAGHQNLTRNPMAKYPVYEIEVVPRSAIRKGDTLLQIGRRGDTYELKVVSRPYLLGGYAKGCDVLWPDDDRPHGYVLGEKAAKHLRIARSKS